MKVFALRVFLPFLVCACSLAAQVTDQVPREIQGFVRSTDNQPIEGVVLRLQSDIGDIMNETTPEGSGRFTFSNLLKGTYYVSAMAPGYREQRQRADLNMSRRVSVYIYLVPIPGAAKAKPPASVVDERYLRIPEPARQEFELASKLLKEKKHEESIQHFRKAVAIHADFPAAHFLLGTALMDLRRWAEAQAALETAVAQDGMQAPAYMALGTALANQGKLAEAEKPLKRGLELNPETAEGQLELGKVYWSLGRWQEAEGPTLKALALRPELSMAHVVLANILLRRNDQRGALAEFREYLRLEPQGAFAAPAREMVAKLEKQISSQGQPN
jgi:tetratricopeptide (TPR) repeat protein